jgi:hypothetical protein
MDEVVPKAHCSIEDKIALLGSEREFQTSLEESSHLCLLLLSLSSLALLLKQRL